MINHSNCDRRERLGFKEAVAQHITSLLFAKGFVCTEQTVHNVNFKTPNVTMAVYHEPLSYEIGLHYSLKNGLSERHDLRDLLDTVLGVDHKKQNFFQASNYDGVVYCIKAIADYLRNYGGDVLAGDPAMYQRISTVAKIRNIAIWKHYEHAPTRKEAEDAWQRRDYSKVCDLYLSMYDDLTPIEKRRLKYAQSHSRSD